MYSVADFGQMIADGVRMDAYVEALRRAVKPGSVVVDLGTGTGIFALWACKLGASRVYAIEPNPAIEVARENAKRNGCAARITFFRAKSTDVELPEKADVLVSDLRGAFPLFGKHLLVIADARKRFLKSGAVQIPEGDEFFAAPVEMPEAARIMVRGYDDGVFDLSACRAAVVDEAHLVPRGVLKPEHLLAAPAHWGSVDYRTDAGLDASGAVEFEIGRDGVGHGFAVWFRAVIAQGVTFTNGPGKVAPVYKPTFLPWSLPTPVQAGSRIAAHLRCTFTPDEYLWGWNTSFGAGPSFKQTTFRGIGATLAELRKAGPGYAPGLGAKGRAAQRVLEGFANGGTQGALADAILAEFPTLFGSREEALPFVQHLARDLGER